MCDGWRCHCEAKWHCEHGDLRLLFLVRSALAMPNCDGHYCNCKAKWPCERGDLRLLFSVYSALAMPNGKVGKGNNLCPVILECVRCMVCRNMRLLVGASHLALTHDAVDLHSSHVVSASCWKVKTLSEPDPGGWILQQTPRSNCQRPSKPPIRVWEGG